MKNTFLSIAIAAITLVACNSGSNTSNDTNKISENQTGTTSQVSPFTSPVNALLQNYLQMKNALANDDTREAANAGNALLKALNDYDITILRNDERNFFADIADDAKEHAEHIGKNAGNIKHQREHFDMLSKDMYDLVKKFAAGQPIYVDYCPMYNDNKGATWLSETKEIKNPYFGKDMNTCGSVKEELK
jgi:hypothetical protein